jgi:RimJ/RimL family protein N-acetyltransferase
MLTLQPLDNEEQLMQIQELKRESTWWVNSPFYVVAHAYLYRSHSDVYCLQDDETVIGVVILSNGDQESCEFTDLVIGDAYLGCGFGKQAVKLIADEFRSRGKHGKVKLSVHKANEIARHIYEQAGYVVAGEADWDNSFINMEFIF